jgi:hypothetical protein
MLNHLILMWKENPELWNNKKTLKRRKNATPICLTSVDITVAERACGRKEYKELLANTVTFISCRHRLTSQLMKARMLAESSLYSMFSLGSLCYSDVYRRESGRCPTLLFFLTSFIESLDLYEMSLRSQLWLNWY